MTRLRAARVLLVLAAVAAVLSAWAFFTGGFRVYVLGIPLSVRGADRAGFVAIVCLVSGFFLHDPLQRRARLLIERLPHRLRPLLTVARVVPVFPALAVTASLLVFLAGTAFGTRAAGGADVYGYVSQAELWRTGDLRIHQDFVASVPWPHAEWTFTPLGYRPAGRYTIVPSYPPGLPLLMLLFSLGLGATGPYYVSWVAGAALVLLTYALGARMSGPVVGITAALSVAVSPIVLMMTFSAMSDVPVSAWWMAALLLATRGTRLSAAASGLAAGAAVLVRPNLVFLAIVPLAISILRSENWRQRWFARAVSFTAAFVPFPLFIAWLFNDLYGSPLTSGYGENAGLFSWDYIAVNIRQYPRWIWESQGPFAFTFLLTPFLLLLRGPSFVLRAAFFTFIVLIFACYLVYLPFDAWWYTRFLLPGYPLMFVLGADVVWSGTAPFGRRAQRAAGTLFAIAMIFFGAKQTFDRDIKEVGHGEQKYAEVGRHVRVTLPPNAIVYAMQHSGTVRHYSGRLTLRYDWLQPNWLDESIEHLVKAGYVPFILLDNWEVPQFRERFASQKYVAVVAEDPPERPCTHTTYLYRIFPAPGLTVSERIPQIARCP